MCIVSRALEDKVSQMSRRFMAANIHLESARLELAAHHSRVSVAELMVATLHQH